MSLTDLIRRYQNLDPLSKITLYLFLAMIAAFVLSSYGPVHRHIFSYIGYALIGVVVLCVYMLYRRSKNRQNITHVTPNTPVPTQQSNLAMASSHTNIPTPSNGQPLPSLPPDSGQIPLPDSGQISPPDTGQIPPPLPPDTGQILPPDTSQIPPPLPPDAGQIPPPLPVMYPGAENAPPPYTAYMTQSFPNQQCMQQLDSLPPPPSYHEAVGRT